VIPRNVADAAAGVMSNVVDGNISGRTGGAMSIGRDTTGKTGTINNNAAVWFVGATPDMAAAVMLYDPRSAQRYPLKNITINGRYYPQVFGSSIPGPTWKAAMEGALEGKDPVPMELRNEWNVRPARQAGTPAQGSVYVPRVADTDVRWWERAYDEFSSRGGNQGQGVGQGPPSGQGQGNQP
jgi:membrane peptidoglycan carboxypeptidase